MDVFLLLSLSLSLPLPVATVYTRRQKVEAIDNGRTIMHGSPPGVPKPLLDMVYTLTG